MSIEFEPNIYESKKEKEEDDLDNEDLNIETDQEDLEMLESLKKEDREIFERAFKNLKDHGVPVDIPNDIMAFESNRKEIKKKKGLSAGTYSPVLDRIIVYKEVHQKKSLLKELEKKYEDTEQGSSKAKAHRDLKRMKMQFTVEKTKEESILPKDIIENAKEDRLSALFKAATGMNEEKFEAVFGKSINKEDLIKSYERGVQTTIEHELLHKLDMDIINQETDEGELKNIQRLRKNYKKFLEDTDFLSILSNDEKYNTLTQHGLDANKIAMAIEKINDKDYEEMIDEMRERVKGLNVEDPDNEELIIHLELEIEGKLEEVYLENKDEIDRFLQKIEERRKNRRENYPTNLSEARNQIWNFYRMEKLSSSEDIEKLKEKLSLYEDKGLDDIARYCDMLLDIYQSTEGEEREKMQNVLIAAEDMIYQTITEKLKQETFKTS